MSEGCVFLGAGGHARVLLDSLLGSGMPLCILDADASLHGSEVHGVPVLGGDDLLPEVGERGFTRFAVAVGALSNNGVRQRLFELAREHGLEPFEVRHATACCSPMAALGQGCQLLPGAIVNAGATLGCNVIVNTGAIVEHDCRIGDHAHVATGARLAGGVVVGARAHIGIGASVRQGIRIGADAVVGAGAAVVKDVPDATVVVGVPAKPQ